MKELITKFECFTTTTSKLNEAFFERVELKRERGCLQAPILNGLFCGQHVFFASSISFSENYLNASMGPYSKLNIFITGLFSWLLIAINQHFRSKQRNRVWICSTFAGISCQQHICRHKKIWKSNGIYLEFCFLSHFLGFTRNCQIWSATQDCENRCYIWSEHFRCGRRNASSYQRRWSSHFDK